MTRCLMVGSGDDENIWVLQIWGENLKLSTGIGKDIDGTERRIYRTFIIDEKTSKWKEIP